MDYYNNNGYNNDSLNNPQGNGPDPQQNNYSNQGYQQPYGTDNNHRVTSSLTVQTIIRVISSSHMVQMIISSHTVHSLITVTTIRITISSSILTTISILQRIKAQRIMLLHHLYSVLQVFAVVLLAVQLVLFLVLILKRQSLKITDLQLQVSFFLLLLQ